MFDQSLAAQGFVVFRMDPRSASTQGARSTWTAYKQLGVKELEDITDAIKWLKKKPFVDGTPFDMRPQLRRTSPPMPPTFCA